ncbi:hypothetical protein NEIG_01866 [Nematocida sp. ERTm5]|nr:hypothetical protein NEIRO02_2116 [Nematocida sp. AWRm79]KAI5185920.1 hypothetical protein NEIRO03_2151 [Nematocida sp. AWRm78]OAG32135.1 hypothetical protein NEIG_01866 [Nematocida sp. ERTm5]
MGKDSLSKIGKSKKGHTNDIKMDEDSDPFSIHNDIQKEIEKNQSIINENLNKMKHTVKLFKGVDKENISVEEAVTANDTNVRVTVKQKEKSGRGSNTSSNSQDIDKQFSIGNDKKVKKAVLEGIVLVVYLEKGSPSNRTIQVS